MKDLFLNHKHTIKIVFYVLLYVWCSIGDKFNVIYFKQQKFIQLFFKYFYVYKEI